MGETFEGYVRVRKAGTTNTVITLDATNGHIVSGNYGRDGDVLLKDGSGVNRIHLDPGNQTIKIRNSSGKMIAELGRNGNLRLGGNEQDGDIQMYKTNNKRTVHVDAQRGNIWLGGNGADGDIVIFPRGVPNSNSTAKATIHLNGDAGDIMRSSARR